MYRPPAPTPLAPIPALMRALLSGRGDLLEMLPARAFQMRIGRMGFSRRGIVLVNDPKFVRQVMVDEVAAFPKNDLFVGALRPLVGDGVLISTGTAWEKQRRMIEPSFSRIHVGRAYGQMQDSVAAFEDHLDGVAERGEPLPLDAAISRLTADIICRTIFSQSLDSGAALSVFDDFAQFQDRVANIQPSRLILGKPWAEIRQPRTVMEACAKIRGQFRHWIEARRADPAASGHDIAADVLAARDPSTGEGFTVEELIDQIGVFFLAGHETTATAVTWALFILSQQPDALARLRAEVAAAAGDGPIALDTVKRLVFTRAVFRETLRLYPPVAFLPRVALQATQIAGHRVPKGAMVMIAPWILHRHHDLWEWPDRFDPDRFLGQREKAIEPGSYLAFSLGPRVCIGNAFAVIEGTLILASLLRRFSFSIDRPERVRPVVRLTTRPAGGLTARVGRLPTKTLRRETTAKPSRPAAAIPVK